MMAAVDDAERVGDGERDGETPAEMLAVGVAVLLDVNDGVPLVDTDGVRVRAGVRVKLVLAVPVTLDDEVGVWLGVSLTELVSDGVRVTELLALTVSDGEVVRAGVCVCVFVPEEVNEGVRVRLGDGVSLGDSDGVAFRLIDEVEDAVLEGVTEADGLPVLLEVSDEEGVLVNEIDPVLVTVDEGEPVRDPVLLIEAELDRLDVAVREGVRVFDLDSGGVRVGVVLGRHAVPEAVLVLDEDTLEDELTLGVLVLDKEVEVV